MICSKCDREATEQVYKRCSDGLYRKEPRCGAHIPPEPKPGEGRGRAYATGLGPEAHAEAQEAKEMDYEYQRSKPSYREPWRR